MATILKSPYVLGGLGAFALFGATIYQYSSVRMKKTGFHHRDPDPSLRIVEKDVLIPKYMKDSARQDKCKAQVELFNDCVRNTEPNTWARLMTFRTCKQASDVMMECMNNFFIDENFYKENKARYLRDKALFHACRVLRKDRLLIKDSIVKGTEPDFQMKEDGAKYYKAVMERFQKTGDVDSYDEELLVNYYNKTDSNTRLLTGPGV